MNTQKTTSAKRKALMYLMLVLALASIATVLIVAITLSNKPIIEPPTDTPDPNDGHDVDVTPITMLVPVSGDYTIDKDFAIDRLLYSTTLKLWMTHSGVDLKAEKGTNVVAILDGVVVDAGDSMIDGGYVIIDHGEGRTSVYKSLELNGTLKAGDQVSRGDVIGKVSDTMLIEIAQGAHLHFELLLDGKNVSPVAYIDGLLQSA